MTQTLMLTFEGRTLSMRQWAREVGLSYACLQTRLRYMSVQEALTRPLSPCGRRSKEPELTAVMIETIGRYLERRLFPRVRAVVYASKRQPVTSTGESK